MSVTLRPFHKLTFRYLSSLFKGHRSRQGEGLADGINCSQVGRRRETCAGAQRARHRRPAPELHYFNSLTIDLLEFKWHTQVRGANAQNIIPEPNGKRIRISRTAIAHKIIFTKCNLFASELCESWMPEIYDSNQNIFYVIEAIKLDNSFYISPSVFP